MVYVRSRKFCCCLPVRFGVFCEALIGIAIGGLFAIGGRLQIHSMRECWLFSSVESWVGIGAALTSSLFYADS